MQIDCISLVFPGLRHFSDTIILLGFNSMNESFCHSNDRIFHCRAYSEFMKSEIHKSMISRKLASRKGLRYCFLTRNPLAWILRESLSASEIGVNSQIRF